MAAVARRHNRDSMNTLQLYLATTLVWGSTWLAITFQLGMVPPEVSVVWRFGLSALVLFAYAQWKKLPLQFSARDHFWMAVQGFFMFGSSYVFVYLAEQSLASGLVAVVFSIIVFWNIIGMRLLFTAPINPTRVVAALIGVAGVILVFWADVANFSFEQLRGLIFAVLGTVAASLGNLAAVRNQRHYVPMIPLITWSMTYGTLFIAIYAALSGYEFSFEWSFSYVASLVYLALFGSVLAFAAYLTLIERIGPDRAAYIGVAIPIVALFLSTLFEDLAWTLSMVVGVVFCVAGNALMLRGSGRRAPEANALSD
jgi:drug/metabolite transporter (DMT)-like permease